MSEFATDDVDSMTTMAVHSSQKSNTFQFSPTPTLEDIRNLQKCFTRERNWDQFHLPRNLLLALVGEVGELAELFQWKGEVKEGVPDWTSEEREQLCNEMSDVLIYLVQLANKCHVDLPAAVLRKLELNRRKYPADKVYGKSEKYTAYNGVEDATDSTLHSGGGDDDGNNSSQESR